MPGTKCGGRQLEPPGLGWRGGVCSEATDLGTVQTAKPFAAVEGDYAVMYYLLQSVQESDVFVREI